MIFFILYKLPIWKNLDNKSRNIRIIIVGIILYIILQSYLYSNYGSNNKYLSEYRSKLYYIIGLDISITGVNMINNYYKDKKKQNKIEQQQLQQQQLQQLQQQQLQQLQQQQLQQLQQQQLQQLQQQQLQQSQPLKTQITLSQSSPESINNETSDSDDISVDNLSDNSSLDIHFSTPSDPRSDTIFTNKDELSLESDDLSNISDIPLYNTDLNTSPDIPVYTKNGGKPSVYKKYTI